jgi:transcriptional regulator with XRE-family HTH domain
MNRRLFIMPQQRSERAEEAIRLRVENRLSMREIAEITGASKGSLSGWLKPFPLTEEERRQRQQSARRYVPARKDRGEQSKLSLAVAGRELTRQEKAKIAEAAVLLRLVLHGFIAFGSVFDGDKADWMVEVPETGRIHKIQVRWVKAGHYGLPLIGLHCSVGHTKQSRYADGDFDFIVGYDLYTDTAFVYSAEEVAPLKSAVAISWEHAERWEKLKQ